MVLVGIFNLAISTKAFVFGVIIMVDLSAAPAVTFDAEMVVALTCQLAASCPTFEQALCQGDAGGDLMLLHLFDGQRGVLLDVVVVGCVPALGMGGDGAPEEEEQQQGVECMFHILLL